MRILLVIALLLIAGGIIFFNDAVEYLASRNVVEPTEEVVVPAARERAEGSQAEKDDRSTTSVEVPEMSVIAENLTIPWDIAFLPGGDMLVTERDGTLLRIDPGTGVVDEIPVPGVAHGGEGGLLGAVLHPDFETNQYLYLYYTTTPPEGGQTINTVMRYRFLDNTLTNATTIVDEIPGALYHDGGRIAFGPDGMLYVATGDATETANAQDRDSLAGKILRMTPEGEVPEGNPFDTLVYSYGHRNPQGLTWDADGNLWSTEHGRSGARSGMDELNRIEPGGNYGWPESEGDTVEEGTLGPVIHSGPDVTWAPASAVHWDGSIFFGGLRGATLYEAVLDDTEVVELREHYAGEFGRIRTVTEGPDGMLYLTTSNRDGRGDVQAGDDKIIRLDPAQFR